MLDVLNSLYTREELLRELGPASPLLYDYGYWAIKRPGSIVRRIRA